MILGASSGSISVLILAAASRPLMPGMRQSITTSATGSRALFSDSMASSPEAADSTWKPNDFR